MGLTSETILGQYEIRSPLGARGTIYLGTVEQGLLAINPDSTVKWAYRSDLAFVTPTIGGDGTIYVPALGTVLHAVNPDGTVKWTMDWSWLRPAPSTSTNRPLGQTERSTLFQITEAADLAIRSVR